MCSEKFEAEEQTICSRDADSNKFFHNILRIHQKANLDLKCCSINYFGLLVMHHIDYYTIIYMYIYIYVL